MYTCTIILIYKVTYQSEATQIQLANWQIIRCHGPSVASQTAKAWEHSLDRFQRAAFPLLHLRGTMSCIQEVLLGTQEWGWEVGKLPFSSQEVWLSAPIHPPRGPRAHDLSCLVSITRVDSTWNCPWCQSRVSISPMTLQYRAPSRE